MKRTLILVLFFIVSCNSFKTDIDPVGTYLYKIEGLGQIKLILNENHRFDYKKEYGLFVGTSKGVWSINQNKLHLKTDFKDKDDYLIVEEFESDNPHIKLSTIDSVPLTGVEILINNKLYITGDKGILSLKGVPKFKSIEVYSILLEESKVYHVKTRNSNTFNIKLVEGSDALIYFDQDFKVKDNALKIEGRVLTKQ